MRLSSRRRLLVHGRFRRTRPRPGTRQRRHCWSVRRRPRLRRFACRRSTSHRRRREVPRPKACPGTSTASRTTPTPRHWACTATWSPKRSPPSPARSAAKRPLTARCSASTRGSLCSCRGALARSPADGVTTPQAWPAPLRAPRAAGRAARACLRPRRPRSTRTTCSTWRPSSTRSSPWATKRRPAARWAWACRRGSPSGGCSA
mmetsp:Transcript_64688/g.202567  ORF Transcript_64688/g.202567 Transcript_64688/m.202567 type:complete len:204 (+) Transcript_64688:377-988(+)